MLTAFQAIGENRNSPRLWIESERLNQIGLPIGTPLVTSLSPCGRELTLTASALGDRRISRHRGAGGFRPTLDINNREVLEKLQPYEEVRVRGTFGRLVVTPSIRATHIHTQRNTSPVWPILDACAGGSTLGDAFAAHPEFRIAAGTEIEPDYADEFSRKNPAAELFLGDIRKIHPDEYPHFVGMLGGIPCNDFAQVGIGTKGLKGTAELGKSGALFLPILEVLSHRYPLFAVFENVPAFGNSLAGKMFVRHLQALGYEVTTFVMNPNEEWAEPTTRNRWVCIALLIPGFQLKIPMTPFVGKVRDFLDAPNPVQDRLDAERIAKSLAGVQRHVARHQEMGHRFRINVLTGEERACPTITRSYYKINASGAYIATEWGPRPFRKSELERLHGHRILTDHWATAVQISGQGVLTRPFTDIAGQIARHLRTAGVLAAA